MQKFLASFKTIANFKGRSLSAIIISSVLLGLATGLNLASRGLENSLLTASVASTGGEVYLETRCERTSSSTCKSRLESLVASHHGEIIGQLSLYQSPNISSLAVISQSAAEPFITTSLSELPAGKLPILAPVDTDINLPSSYIVAGEYPSISANNMSLSGFHFSNLALSYIGGEPALPTILIDRDSNETEDFLTEYFAKASEFPNPTVSQIVAFESTADTKSYQLAATSPNTDYSEILVLDLFSNTSSIIHSFRFVQIILNIVTAICIIIAIFAVAITISSVLKSAQSTHKSSPIPYCSYTLAINLSILIGTIIMTCLVILIIQLVDSSALATFLQSFYHLTYAPIVSFCALSGNFWWILGTIILFTPVVLLLNFDKIRHQSSVKGSKTRKSNSAR